MAYPLAFAGFRQPSRFPSAATPLLPVPEYCSQLQKVKRRTLSTFRRFRALVARKVSEGGKIELEFPASTLKPVSADALATIAEVVSTATGGSVGIKGARDAGFFLLVHVDDTFDLEHAEIDSAAFVRLRRQSPADKC